MTIMKDWLTPDEQAQVNEANFWGWHEVANRRRMNQESLRYALIALLVVAVVVGISYFF